MKSYDSLTLCYTQEKVNCPVGLVHFPESTIMNLSIYIKAIYINLHYDKCIIIHFSIN